MNASFFQGKGFFGKQEWPGNSADLNPAEDMGSIVKEKVNHLMREEEGPGRYSEATLKTNLEIVLSELQNDIELFERLLLSYPKRLEAVKAAFGGNTDF